MAHNTRIRNPGFWTPGSVVMPAEMEALDAAQYVALSENGGTWAIASNMLIGGQTGVSWRFTLPLVVDDLAGHVKSGKTLAIDAGGLLNVSGTVDFLSGSVAKVEAGATIRILGIALPLPSAGSVRFEANSRLYCLSGSSSYWYYGSNAYLFGNLHVGTDPAVPGAPPGVITVGADGLVELYGQQNVRPGALFQVRSSGGTFGTIQVDYGALTALAGTMVVADQGQPTSGSMPAGTIILGNNVFGPGHLKVTNGSDIFVGGGSIDVFGLGSSVNWTGGAKGSFSGPSSNLSILDRAKIIVDGNGTVVQVLNNAAMVFGDTTELTFNSGSTLWLGSGSKLQVRTDINRTGADIPSGDGAYSCIRPPKIGPNANEPGKTYVEVDLSSAEIWHVPPLPSTTYWRLVPPPGNRPMIRWIRQLDGSTQNNGLGILDNAGGDLATIGTSATTGKREGSLMVFFDGGAWRAMFSWQCDVDSWP